MGEIKIDREELAELLKAHIEPIHVQLKGALETIARLERLSEKMAEVLIDFARQDEAIKHLREDVTQCNRDRDDLFTRVRHNEATIETLKPLPAKVQKIEDNSRFTLKDAVDKAMTAGLAIAAAYVIAKLTGKM